MKMISGKVAFFIYGEDFDPNYITEILNVFPNNTTIKGIFPPGKSWPAIETTWCIETGYEESDNINIQLKNN